MVLQYNMSSLCGIIVLVISAYNSGQAGTQFANCLPHMGSGAARMWPGSVFRPEVVKVTKPGFSFFCLFCVTGELLLLCYA